MKNLVTPKNIVESARGTIVPSEDQERSDTQASFDEYGRFEDLKNTVDRTKAREYFESVEKTKIKAYRVNAKIDRLLREFIIKGGFEV
jgi:type I restriction enzyme R subunit